MNTRGGACTRTDQISVTVPSFSGLSNVVGEIKPTIIILKDGVGEGVDGLVVSNPLVSAGNLL